MKAVLGFFLLFTASFIVPSVAISQETKSIKPPSPDELHSGVKLLMNRMLTLHPTPYRFHSWAEIRAEAKEFDNNVEHLDSTGVFLEAARLLGMLRDAHSWVWIDDDAKRMGKAMPLRFWRFSDGVFVRAAAPKLSEFVGARVLAIGGVPIETAWKKLTDVQPGANDSMGTKSAQVFLEITDYLRVLGLANSDEMAVLRLQLPSGAIRDVESSRRGLFKPLGDMA